MPDETAELRIPDAIVGTTSTGIFIEWHDHGLNIEVRARPDGVYVLIEDAQGEVARYAGKDSGAVGLALAALCVMEERAAAVAKNKPGPRV